MSHNYNYRLKRRQYLEDEKETCQFFDNQPSKIGNKNTSKINKISSEFKWSAKHRHPLNLEEIELLKC